MDRPNIVRSTMKKYTLIDGTEILLTVNFGMLMALRNSGEEGKKQYEKYMGLLENGISNLDDEMQVLYTAYLCGRIDEEGEAMDYQNFLYLVPPNVVELAKDVRELINPKKK